MTATCPACGEPLNAFSIRSSFICKSCSARLRGRITGPLVAALAVWQLADLFIYPVVVLIASDAWPALLLRIVVSASVGFPLYAFLIGRFATIEVADGDA